MSQEFGIPEEVIAEFEKAAAEKENPLESLENTAKAVDPVNLASLVRKLRDAQAEGEFPNPASPDFNLALGRRFGLSDETARYFIRCGADPEDEVLTGMAEKNLADTDLGPGDKGERVENFLRLFGQVRDVAAGAETNLDDVLEVLERVATEK